MNLKLNYCGVSRYRLYYAIFAHQCAIFRLSSTDVKGKFSANMLTVQHTSSAIASYRAISIYIRGKLEYRYITIALCRSQQRRAADNPTVRPRRNASEAFDIAHFPIVDAFIMRSPQRVCIYSARLHIAKCRVSRTYTY